MADEIKLPGYRDVNVRTRRNSKDGTLVELIYCGPAQDLIHAGLATQEMLQPVLAGPRSRKKLDEHGRPWCRSQYFRSSDGEPVRCFRLTRWWPIKSAKELPGCAEVLAYDAAMREARLRRDEQIARAFGFGADLGPPSVSSSGPAARRRTPLRLVVDNTHA